MDHEYAENGSEIDLLLRGCNDRDTDIRTNLFALSNNQNEKPNKCDNRRRNENKNIPKYCLQRILKMKNFFRNNSLFWTRHLTISKEWHLPRYKFSTLKRNIFLAVLTMLLLLYVNLSVFYGGSDYPIRVVHHSHVPGMKDYLVWSEQCKIPNIDPYQADVMEHFRRQKYEPCSALEPLTRVHFDNETKQYVLSVIKERASFYHKTGTMNCCYQEIIRNGTGKGSDDDISHSKCIAFADQIQIAPTIDNILVRCKTKKNKQLYINGHPLMPEREEIRQRLKKWQSRQQLDHNNATSVLIIGIDSVSRINLIRAMPKTAQYLYDNEWFEMSGYNKVDDNTFPNLMALLTGRNSSDVYENCPPRKMRGLDNCNFIWRSFRDHGYVTAYAEDAASISTFNYLKQGFERPPVDYYMRPFLLSAEKHLPFKLKSSLKWCLGYQNSADFIYNYALELATRYEHNPYFGLFWTNTFSHNAISDCSAMDEHMVEYLSKFAALGILNKTIVIFLSDHGQRFGPTLMTLSGHMEDRLPFLFISLPPHLKHSHPEFVDALNVNKNRLTNPYDLHMTLKHVLRLTGRVTDPKELAPAIACARCQTLLEPVLYNRSCEDIAIEDHWCTCLPYDRIANDSSSVKKIALAMVEYINNLVSTSNKGFFAKRCRTLHLQSIESAYRAQITESAIDEIYRINFITQPNMAFFEATVRRNTVTAELRVTGEISRLDGYAQDAYCISDGAVKKYCSCHKKDSG